MKKILSTTLISLTLVTNLYGVITEQQKDDFFELVEADNIKVLKSILNGMSDEAKKEIVNAKSYFGFTPLQIATLNKQTDVAQLLLDNGADVITGDFFNQVKAGNIQALESILNRMSDEEKKEIVNAKSYFGYTPLHTAACYKRVAVAEILFENGADINEKDDSGMTPLHNAAQNKAIEFAEWLISQGAIIDAKDDFGKTPLHHAAESSCVAITRSLIRHGANINERNKRRRGTTLHSATQFYSDLESAPPEVQEMVKFLVVNGATINVDENDQPKQKLYRSSVLWCDETKYRVTMNQIAAWLNENPISDEDRELYLVTLD